MPEKESHKSARYLYAFICESDDQSFGDIGIDGGNVYTIANNQVSAVVSDVANKRMRPQRRHLSAHQQVLKQLMKTHTPLPVSFGIIVNSPEEIKQIISKNQEAFDEQLERLNGKMEMGLRVSWDTPNIFDYFVSTHPELRAARDKFFGTHHEPCQEDKIELGRMFDNLLHEDREKYAGLVEDVLSDYCYDIKNNPCRNEREVMNLSCLIGRDEEARFEEGILKAAGMFDNNFAFDYNGPWAPHNFTDMDLVF